MEHQGKKRPKDVFEYFALLYCKRKKFKCAPQHSSLKDARKAWKSLNYEERQVFIDQFERQLEKYSNRMAKLLQYAEPYLKKKKKYEEKDISNRIEKREDYNDEEILRSIDTTHYSDNISNADTEILETNTTVPKVDCDEQAQPTPDSGHNTDDNISNPDSNITNQVYAASVIDTDIDESVGQPEITVVVESEKLTEPTPPTLSTGKELFETLKESGTQPELATLEWKRMPQDHKRRFQCALRAMKKEYLIKYEQYLESLPNEELFQHYIKTLNM